MDLNELYKTLSGQQKFREKLQNFKNNLDAYEPLDFSDIPTYKPLDYSEYDKAVTNLNPGYSSGDIDANSAIVTQDFQNTVDDAVSSGIYGVSSQELLDDLTKSLKKPGQLSWLMNDSIPKPF